LAVLGILNSEFQEHLHPMTVNEQDSPKVINLHIVFASPHPPPVDLIVSQIHSMNQEQLGQILKAIARRINT
jgi:hypothetical protein